MYSYQIKFHSTNPARQCQLLKTGPAGAIFLYIRKDGSSLCSPNNKKARVEILATDGLVTRTQIWKARKKGRADLAMLPHQIKRSKQVEIIMPNKYIACKQHDLLQVKDALPLKNPCVFLTSACMYMYMYQHTTVHRYRSHHTHILLTTHTDTTHPHITLK